MNYIVNRAKGTFNTDTDVKKMCGDVIALSLQHSEHTDFFSFSSTNSMTKILYLGYLFACARGFALQIRPAGLPAGYSIRLHRGRKNIHRLL